MIRVGTSGWSYDHWQNVLYPPATPTSVRLAHYVPHFSTVEVNSTFYRWPRSATFASWHRRVPPEFIMSVKAPRGLTHGARLYAPERWIPRITESVSSLGDRRGPLLVQLPPDLSIDYARLAYFLAQVPSWLRVVVELRHPSWHREDIFTLLERHSAAYCVMSGAALPCILRATASFVYVRLHGADQHHLYAGSYSEENLQWWAARCREWATGGRDVFVYFNNDGEGHAVRNAARLATLLR